MLRFLTIFILLAIPVGLFFVFIDPVYKEIQAIRIQTVELEETFSNSQKVQEVRDALFSKFNAIPQKDLDRLEKLLPSNTDNVKLILELDAIASRNGMDIKSINVSGVLGGSEGGLGPSGKPYGSSGIGLVLTGSYKSFKGFIADLERSLRLADIVSLSFRATGEDFDQYNVALQTYWLR